MPTYGFADPTWPNTATTQKPIRVSADAVVSPIPTRLIGLCARKTSGLIRLSPNSPYLAIAQSLIRLFFLQGTDVCDDVSDLRISELAGVSRHLALAILGDGDKICVRLTYDIG